MNPLLPTVTGGLKKTVTFLSSVTFHQQANSVHALQQYKSFTLFDNTTVLAAAAAVIWHLRSTANRRREQVADSDPANHRKRCGTLKNLKFEIETTRPKVKSLLLLLLYFKSLYI